jgi:hypothetical protein
MTIINEEIIRRLEEEGKSGNYQYIANNDNIVKNFEPNFKPEKILEPLFGELQKITGGHEVIARSFLLDEQNENFSFILDDIEARDLLQNRNAAHLCNYMKWTTDFIKDCHCISKILPKSECTTILNEMRDHKSLFLTDDKCEEVKRDIRLC